MDAKRQILPSGALDSSSQKETARLHLLIETGLALACERDLDTIVQTALEAARQLASASFGVFFYTATGEDGGPIQLYKLSAEDPAKLVGITPVADLFSPALFGNSIFRTDDITHNPLFGGNSPFSGTPLGHLPVRSYMSVPVCTQHGDHIGGMIFGHPAPGIFSANNEQEVKTIAAQACAAMENARLADTLTQEIAIADAARLAQRETAERLASVFESTTDGIALMDRNWRFTYLNKRANDTVAPDRDVTGMPYLELFPDAAGSVFEQRYAEAMNERRVVEFTDYYAPLDLWACIRVFPTSDGIAIFFQDVTPQRRAERTSVDATLRLRQALDAGQLGTWTWSRETDLLDLDERANELLDGDGPHVPVARTQLRKRIVHEEDLGQTPESMRDILLSGGSYNAEYRVETRDGHQYWVSSRGVAVFSPSPTAEPGAPPNALREMTGMIGTVQDITARKTQEATLRQSEKLAATGRLAATIAHEINNPLEAVTNLIYLSKTDPGVPLPIAHLLDTADNELARVAQIAQQTLGFYRDTTRPIDINLTEMLEGVINLFSRKMEYKRITCELDLARDLHIFGLQGEVRQVFSNLIVNAIDASSRTPIHVRARACISRGRPGVSVLISDRGTGIPLAVRQQLFSPFFTTKQSVGTGLGLWATRGIVEKQGGSIRFRTSTENPSGTIFRVFLPTEFLNPDKFSATQSKFIQ
jgi:signal transduction histidine kinase